MSLLDNIKYKYWDIVPYNWRPSQIWYRLKCFLWYRYTTIKPRTLNFHTWCDKTELIPHIMFECLSEFLEKECSPGIVDWKGSNHVIKFGGRDRNVIDVMWHLYNWWFKVYLVKIDTVYDQWHNWTTEHRKDNLLDEWPEGQKFITCKTYWDSEENRLIGEKLFKRCERKYIKLQDTLNEHLKTIVDLIPYMWT